MNKHHYYLKNLLKITVPKIDDMINAALNTGALGAKIVGSGGGGSITVLAPKNREEHIIKASFGGWWCKNFITIKRCVIV